MYNSRVQFSLARIGSSSPIRKKNDVQFAQHDDETDDNDDVEDDDNDGDDSRDHNGEYGENDDDDDFNHGNACTFQSTHEPGASQTPRQWETHNFPLFRI